MAFSLHNSGHNKSQELNMKVLISDPGEKVAPSLRTIKPQNADTLS